MIRSLDNKRLIIIGSSTGGPLILEQIFAGLPCLPVTIIIVQHIRAFFMPDLLRHIQAQTAMQVIMPATGDDIRPGYVYVAPAGHHLILEENRSFALYESEKVNSVRPSIDVAMKSVRKDTGLSVMGIVLTGMGRDGTEGLKYLKSIGGIAIAQDPVTSPIRTMPQNAIDAGIADAVCSPEDIQKIIKKFSSVVYSGMIDLALSAGKNL